MRRSLLSKFFLAAGTVLLAGCVATKNVPQEPPPLWASYETLSEVFPPQDYLAQIGFSDTAERAQVQADAALSSYISHTVLVQWLRLMCYNFPFAFFTQLFFIQPFVRTVFKLLFARNQKAGE